MKWNDFIKPIRQSGISRDAAGKILNRIFMAAGYPDEIPGPTAKSWLQGDRSCKTSMYFPTGEVDAKRVFRYFRDRPDSKLQQLQRIFREQALPDSDSPIDTETSDLDRFCWSLVNQFLDLLSFPRIDIPGDEALNHSARGAKPLESQASVPSAGTLNVGKQSIRSKILPHSDAACCYHCTHWKGNRKIFSAYITPTYGPCIKHNRTEQLSSAPACDDYEKYSKSLGDW